MCINNYKVLVTGPDLNNFNREMLPHEILEEIAMIELTGKSSTEMIDMNIQTRRKSDNLDEVRMPLGIVKSVTKPRPSHYKSYLFT